ncbi:hypothetical protein LTS18_002634 [Coniosporium uncinatum]|uniref:Uncharacterized protein n=1 Tax=Coniosporium uncinatum TaxID=93489 RepID=A0ACC3DU34_9PEZI|nr:hypothetical protein LTS18_002634 [Coniosporium uncinatum]
MASVARPDHFVHVRCLYRQLQRECTYLPDAAARVYISKHISYRFREYTQYRFDHRLDEPKERLKSVLRKAERGILFLRRANAGEYEPLLKVLMHTYGRVGKRKHELLAPILRPDQPTEDENENFTVEKQHVDLKGHPLTGIPAPLTSPKKNEKDGSIEFTISEKYQKLIALAKSHKASPSQTSNSSRPTVRSVVQKVPELNLWMRPQPRKRLASMSRNWYRKLLEKIMPPLPEEEWNRLEALVAGQVSWKDPRVRRANSAVKPNRLSFRDLAKFTLNEGESTDKHHIGQGDQWMQESSQVRQVMTDLVNHHARLGKVDTKTPSLNTPHAVTPRFMQRLWLAVFVQCPKMTWDGDTNKWIVEWGHLPASSDRGRFKKLTYGNFSNPQKTSSPLEALFSEPNERSRQHGANKIAAETRAGHKDYEAVSHDDESKRPQSTTPL